MLLEEDAVQIELEVMNGFSILQFAFCVLGRLRSRLETEGLWSSWVWCGWGFHLRAGFARASTPVPI